MVEGGTKKLTEVSDDALVVLGGEDVAAVRAHDEAPDVDVQELLRVDLKVGKVDGHLDKEQVIEEHYHGLCW